MVYATTSHNEVAEKEFPLWKTCLLILFFLQSKGGDNENCRFLWQRTWVYTWQCEYVIKDRYGSQLGYIDGLNSIKNNYGSKVGEIRSNGVFDSYGSRIGDVTGDNIISLLK
jgi:hypothetical protein